MNHSSTGKNVKQAVYAWPPSSSTPVPSTIPEDQRRCIPPIHGVAEQLMNQAVANGGPMPPKMYLPAFSINMPQIVPDTKMLMWPQFNEFVGPSSLPPPPIVAPQNPNKPYLGQYQLSPLSNGGFLYSPNVTVIPPAHQGFLFPPTPNQSQGRSDFHTSPMLPQQISKIEDEITIKPSMVAQTRTEKIEKYRNKRSSRNWNRQADPSKKAVAQSRPRDATGQFLSDKDPVRLGALHEVMKQLEMTQKESKLLHERLSAMENELAQLRNHAIESRISEENAKRALEAQRNLNHDLLSENQFLWQTVPQDEIFTTLNPDHPYVDREPFLSKIDLSEIENTLAWTSSHYLEQARENNCPSSSPSSSSSESLAENTFFSTSNS